MIISKVLDKQLNSIKPAFNRMLVQKIEDNTTESGLILQKPEDEEDDNTILVKVIALGAGCISNLKIIGTNVIIGKYSGIELAKDKGFIIVNEQDILATV